MATDPQRDNIEAQNAAVTAEARRRARRSFIAAAAAVAAGGAGFVTLMKSRSIGMLRVPLRKAEEFNRLLAEHVIGELKLAKTYPLHLAVKRARVNGLGLRRDMDPTSWRLQVAGLSSAASSHPKFVSNLSEWKYRYSEEFVARTLELDGETALQPVSTMKDNSIKEEDPLIEVPNRFPPVPGLLLTMEDLKALPFTEYATEFKCIEGWSDIMHFGGVRFRDFMEAFPPQRGPDGALPKYVAMTTADGSYFSAFEIAAMVHPQTLLCYEMSGKELLPAHGAPLRLSMPLKYGYKQIKQIARITYTNERPYEYWERFGYDWHGGI
jgi:hypothetical protein